MTIRSGTMKTYYLFLHLFPVFILFLNGFVLGAFLLLYLTYYSERVFEFLAALFPHGVFEIPGIILAGSIGLKIAELGKLETVQELKNRMNNVVKGTFSRYLVVVALLVIGGIMEGSMM
jgi:stage II sporulation protein M